MNKFIILFLTVAFFSCSPQISNLETPKESPSYDMEFVRAARVTGSSKNNLSVVFLVTPKNEDTFPPIVSMKLRYIIDGKEEYINIGKQEGEGRVQIGLYGKDVKDENPKIHAMIKDKIQLDDYEDMILLAFEFTDKIEMDVKEMGIIYGFWEMKNQDLRIEKRYDFQIENIDVN